MVRATFGADADAVVFKLASATPSTNGGVIINLRYDNTDHLFGDATAGITKLVLNAGDGNDSFTIVDKLPILCTLIGGAGDDTLTGPSAATTWVIDGANSGSIDNNATFSGFENVVGGGDADFFQFALAGALNSLTGGWLDYTPGSGAASELSGTQKSMLAQLTVGVADLDGLVLGMTTGSTIWIDRDAAGWGWSVDPTPADSSEFVAGPSGMLTASAGSPAFGHIDLLSVIMHEVGHAIGLEHTDEGVMSPTLQAGVRQIETGSDAEAFAQPSSGPVELMSGRKSKLLDWDGRKHLAAFAANDTGRRRLYAPAFPEFAIFADQGRDNGRTLEDENDSEFLVSPSSLIEWSVEV